MSIKIAGVEPSDIKLGSQQVKSVYAGSKEVWSDFVFEPVGIFSSTTWSAPVAGTYKFHLIGGGGNGSDWPSSGSTHYGAGGGSGRYATADVDLSSGQQVTISIGTGGATGGTTSIAVGGSTVASASGGRSGSSSSPGAGGAGGSGGGGAPNDANFTASFGGYHGSNGANGGAAGGGGQLGVAFGNGANPYIPPGGCSAYKAALAGAYYDGIAGFGAGAQAAKNQDAICAGGGAGGSEWGFPVKAGKAGMVVIV